MVFINSFLSSGSRGVTKEKGEKSERKDRSGRTVGERGIKEKLVGLNMGTRGDKWKLQSKTEVDYQDSDVGTILRVKGQLRPVSTVSPTRSPQETPTWNPSPATG